jgi:hypothetical protein
MLTKDGHYVGSSWIKRDNKISRNNYCVAVNFLMIYYFVFMLLITNIKKKNYFRL